MGCENLSCLLVHIKDDALSVANRDGTINLIEPVNFHFG